MHSIPVRYGAASRLVLVLLLIFGASGCAKQSTVGKLPACGDKTVDVNTTNGAEPQAVYVCGGDAVTWNSNGHTFLVQFTKQDSPFSDGNRTFNNGKPKSDTTKRHDKLKVYEYQITVDGQLFADPQVVGGGGGH
jgi:plastocyanin